MEEIASPMLPANNSESISAFFVSVCDIFGQTVHPVKLIKILNIDGGFDGFEHLFIATPSLPIILDKYKIFCWNAQTKIYSNSS